MIPLILCALIASTSAISLAPATVSGGISRNFEFFMSNQESVNGLLQTMSGMQGALGFSDMNYMNQIAGEIFLYADIMNSNPNHALKWQLKINKGLGSMRVIDISAKSRAVANGRTLVFVGKAFEINQPIPQAFDVVEHCVEGKRKYKIAGPRSRTCTKNNVPRGLNQGEINEINQALINKIADGLRSV